MKNPNRYSGTRATLVAAAVAALLAACASTPPAPAGAMEARSKLMTLKSDPNLATRAPVAIEQAETAVVLAEKPEKNAELLAHRVYLANRSVDTARALAETRLAESQRPELRKQAESERLAARTREADAAHDAAATARSEADAARSEADATRSAANTAATAAAAAAALSAEQAQELARQIALLQAKTTERGIVLTLGDVLFATGSANINPGAVGNLDRLVAFLGKYPERTASIEGHTDSVGADDYNQGLSQRRADAVKSYLANQGVSSNRLTTIGKGEIYPVASNDSAAGRQQNRRVEVVINNDVKP